MKEFSDYQHYIAKSRYSRYLPNEERRETWKETVTRYCDFFKKRNECFPYEEMFNAIYNLEDMPSMRCLMTAGPALDRDNAAGYNCSYVAIDNQRAFDEAFYLLMNGVGVGYSVERQFINKLPIVSEDFFDTDSVITIKDSKIGWASGLREIISLLYQGRIPKWDLSKVRPAGAPLKTFGGRASGPAPLDELFKFVIHIFKNSQGRKLTSLECNDIMCKIGEAVVVGGVRRSACISLTNLSDDRMRSAKSGQWWIENGQRALANISVAYTEKPDVPQFIEEWLSLYNSKSGERGIFNRVAAVKKATELGRRDPQPLRESGGSNPCVTGDMICTVLHNGKLDKMRVSDAIDLFNDGEKLLIESKNTATDSVCLSEVTDAALTRKNAKILKLTDDVTGKFIKVTEDHLVYTKNRGYVEARDLKEDDILDILK
jgi:ribonucleoside-diphosphate reductase alpha chain